MDGLFAYIWKNSHRDQIAILALVLISFPFYYVSLDLPKAIVNDAIQGHAFIKSNEAVLFHLTVGLWAGLGGRTWTLFPGIPLSRLDYLLWLSGAFLALTLINGAFKYVINMQKGKLGERILQRLRLDLFSLLLRFSPEAIRNVKASEAATIIKDEVEPIGNFVGDAFVQPVFLGGQAATALLFILLQSPLLGAVAGGMILIQGFTIPRMRREQLRLGKQRQLQSRALAGRIGEVVEGMPEVDNHGTAGYERHRIARLLDQLFHIRYKLYGRKFMVKFINNMLSQITPFMFYSIGGYFALRGTLDIGQLVAVIAAYRDLPPPIKELIDWDQQRLDVDIKYHQVLEQFSGRDSGPGDSMPLPAISAGCIEVQGLRAAGSGGEALLDGINASIPLGSHTALLASAGDGAGVLAQIIGRRVSVYSGSVRIGGHDLAELSAAAIGPRMAYAGSQPTIFQGTIRENVLYSLNHLPSQADGASGDHRPAVAAEAGVWIDYLAAGAAGPEDIDDRIVETMRAVGMDEAVYRFGLGQKLDPAQAPELAGRLVSARHALKETMVAENAQELIEPFDPERFNRNATIGENLVFGVALADGFGGRTLIDDPIVRTILEQMGLTRPLTLVGLRIAEVSVEIFAGLSADHFLFEQFSLVSAADLPLYDDIVRRTKARGEIEPASDDSAPLLTLALMYVEPRHRLGLLTPELMERIIRARTAFIAAARKDLHGAVEFYDPVRYCAAAPLRDNLLFGRIAYGAPGATERVFGTARRILAATGLDREIYRLGLAQQAGPGGRLLFPSQCSAIGLARCLIKRPDILILNEAITAFGEVDARAMLQRIKRCMSGRTLIVVTRDPELAPMFDNVFDVRGGRIKTAESASPASSGAPSRREDIGAGRKETSELQALRAVPMLADLDGARLKLIALASERMTFAAGQMMFRQGESSDSAYIVLDGALDAWLETPAGKLHLSRVGADSIVGEMGVISGAPRSATIIAAADTATLRLSRDVLLGLLAEFPQIALAVMRAQNKRIIAAEARL